MIFPGIFRKEWNVYPGITRGQNLSFIFDAYSPAHEKTHAFLFPLLLLVPLPMQ